VNYRLMSAVILAVLVSGCTDLAQRVRQYTYPPEFRYVERDEVRGTMRVLAFHAREIHELMRQDEVSREHRAEIVEHLRAMEVAAGTLNQSGWSTNHPKIDVNLPSFRRDLKFAREAVEKDPPNFLLASSVTAACANCHGGKRPPG